MKILTKPDLDAAARELIALRNACEMVLKRWTFNADQQPTHNWHDRADCFDAIHAALEGRPFDA